MSERAEYAADFVAAMESLDGDARLLFATLTALSALHGEPEIEASLVKWTSGLSNKRFAEATATLVEECAAFTPRRGVLSLGHIASFLCLAVGAPGRPSAKAWAALKADVVRTAHGCVYCGDQHRPLVPDHVIPVARGGSNHRINLVPACESCNSAKRDKPWPEWSRLMESRRAAR